MQEIIGQYCKDCKIFAETLEESALSTIYSICNHPVFSGTKIRIMPDCHDGRGIVIGFSCPVPKAINPSHVGCDIGCSMSTIQLSSMLKKEDYPLFEQRIRNIIPLGLDNINTKIGSDIEKGFYKFATKEYRRVKSLYPDYINDIDIIDEKFIMRMCRNIHMDLGVFFKSFGTIGSGNHFMEYGENDETGFFTIHCGSRNFGIKVFNYWNKIAEGVGLKITKEKKKEITERVKSEHPEEKSNWGDLISAEIDKEKSKVCNGYLYGDDKRGYLSDMVIAQSYAKYNHKVIIDRVSEVFKRFHISVIDSFSTTHNYIDFEDMIIRKGAINASLGKKVIIPFNMRDGIAICTGKGNEEWNCTAPHGAGRIMSRSKAKENLSIDEFRREMKDVYSTSISHGTIDESPMAYKDTNEILRLIEPTVDVNFLIKSKINFKGDSE